MLRDNERILKTFSKQGNINLRISFLCCDVLFEYSHTTDIKTFAKSLNETEL